MKEQLQLKNHLKEVRTEANLSQAMELHRDRSIRLPDFQCNYITGGCESIKYHQVAAL